MTHTTSLPTPLASMNSARHIKERGAVEAAYEELLVAIVEWLEVQDAVVVVGSDRVDSVVFLSSPVVS